MTLYRHNPTWAGKGSKASAVYFRSSTVVHTLCALHLPKWILLHSDGYLYPKELSVISVLAGTILK